MFTRLSIFVVLLISLFFAPAALAVEVPDFPSCLNPSGSLIASYATGTHGIVGSPSAYSGSDQVYQVSDSQVMQCFCSPDGTGIQTNWWKASSLNQEQIDQLNKLGWQYIPDGSAWGLGQSAYFAKNIAYNCLGGGSSSSGSSNPGPGSTWVCTLPKPGSPALISVDRQGATAKLTWTSVNDATHYMILYGTDPVNFQHGVSNTGKVTTFTIGSLDPNQKYYFEVRAVNDCMPGDPAGQILGASTAIGGGDVLGLATTGGNWVLYSLVGLGVSCIIAGLYVRRHEQV